MEKQAGSVDVVCGASIVGSVDVVCGATVLSWSVAAVVSVVVGSIGGAVVLVVPIAVVVVVASVVELISAEHSVTPYDPDEQNPSSSNHTQVDPSLLIPPTHEVQSFILEHISSFSILVHTSSGVMSSAMSPAV